MRSAAAPIVTLTQGQFSTDAADGGDAHPLTWHVPVRATAGGAVAQVVTAGTRRRRSRCPAAARCSMNAGQTGYYRTLYQRPQAEALRGRASRTLGPVDQYGLIERSAGAVRCRLSADARRPRFSQRRARERQRQAASQSALGHWSGLYDDFEAIAAAQAAIAARNRAATGRGFSSSASRRALASRPSMRCLRPSLIGTLGKCRGSDGAGRSPPPVRSVAGQSERDSGFAQDDVARHHRAQRRCGDLGCAPRQARRLRPSAARANLALPASRLPRTTKRSRAARSTLRSPTSRERPISAGIIARSQASHPRTGGRLRPCPSRSR